MHDLVVNSELPPLVTNNQHPNTPTSVIEAVAKTGEKTALIKDGQTLLDIARLSHGDDTAVIAD
ncbi:hypothetical protein LTR66_013364, partial [Elasticomyces elasticus]